MKMTTLCYIEKDGKYLMLHRTKKQHDINKDKWIGVRRKRRYAAAAATRREPWRRAAAPTLRSGRSARNRATNAGESARRADASPATIRRARGGYRHSASAPRPRNPAPAPRWPDARRSARRQASRGGVCCKIRSRWRGCAPRLRACRHPRYGSRPTGRPNRGTWQGRCRRSPRRP